MSVDISKACADALRLYFSSVSSNKLKASHARELVAAFFGYKSHAALRAEEDYPVHLLFDAHILVPDVKLLEERRTRLDGLASDAPASLELARLISDFLLEHRYFTGQVWLYDSLESYVTDVFLPDNVAEVMDQISGQMAETNAYFDEMYYESAELTDLDDTIVVKVIGQCNGESDSDKPFCGDQIDLEVTVTLHRAAGLVSYSDVEIRTAGEINDDWVDPEVRYGRLSVA